MNVFISKFLDNYVFAKHVEDSKQQASSYHANLDREHGGMGVRINRVDPDKQLVLDGLGVVFPTMHIGQERLQEGMKEGTREVGAGFLLVPLTHQVALFVRTKVASGRV